MEKIYCLYCGKEMDADSDFCPRCGKSTYVEDEPIAPVARPKTTSTARPQQRPSQQRPSQQRPTQQRPAQQRPTQSTQHSRPSAMEMRAKQKKTYDNDYIEDDSQEESGGFKANLKYIIPLALILIAIIVAVIVLITPGCSSQSSSDTTTTNATSKGGYTIEAERTMFHVGASEKLSVSINPQPKTTPKIIWSSSDSKIAKVTQDGELTTYAEGKCTITAKSDDGFGTIEISVKANHEWTEGEQSIEATCEKDGEKQFTCPYCDETKSETVKSKGHQYPDQPKEIQKDKSGCQLIYVCEVCGNEKEEGGEHTWDDGEVTTEPTCQTIGEKKYTCTRCGYEKTEELPESEHVYVNGKCKWCPRSEIVGEWVATDDDGVRYNIVIYDNNQYEYAEYSSDTDEAISYSGKWASSSDGYSFSKSEGGSLGSARFEDGSFVFYPSFKDGHITLKKS